MKATVTHEFKGCHDGCPYCSDTGVMSPEYCSHSSFVKPKKIIGYSSSSCEIPKGMDHPEWCPIANSNGERSKNTGGNVLDKLVEWLYQQNTTPAQERINPQWNQYAAIYNTIPKITVPQIIDKIDEFRRQEDT